jgi:Bacterial SH3 domain
MAVRTAHISTRSARYTLGPGAYLPIARLVALLLLLLPIGAWPVISSLAEAEPSQEAREIANLNPQAIITDQTPHFLPKPVAALAPEGGSLASDANAERVKVANTDGSGAIVRTEPPTGRQVAGLREGTQVQVLERRTLDGAGEWLRVSTPDGVEGWVYGRLVAPSE